MAAMAQRTEMERGFGYIGVFFFFTLFQHCTGYCSSLVVFCVSFFFSSLLLCFFLSSSLLFLVRILFTYSLLRLVYWA